MGGLRSAPQKVLEVAKVTYDGKSESPTFGKILVAVGTVVDRNEKWSPTRLMKPSELKGLQAALKDYLKKPLPNRGDPRLYAELLTKIEKSMNAGSPGSR